MKAIDGGGESGVYHVSSGSDYSIKELFDATVKAMELELDDEVEVRPRNPDDALHDPARPVEDASATSTGAARRRSRTASRRRSTTTASTAIDGDVHAPEAGRGAATVHA